MNVAFVGHDQQLRSTRSSDFLIRLMKARWGQVTVFPSDWKWLHLPRRPAWDLVVFWQHLPERLLLDSVTIKNVVLIPMYDDCRKDKEFWDQYVDCGIVCFSRAMAELLEGWGHRVHHVQYFPEVPAESVDWSRGLRSAFFWPRKPDLDWTVARRLLLGWNWEGVHLHITEGESDRTRDVTPEDRARLHIRQTRWFSDAADFKRELTRSQAFLAPRRTEGIGMSFLEAMALGMAVVAPDASTMNEYIKSEVNGFLYDPDNAVPPSWRDAPRLGRAARQSIVEGRERWLRSVPALMEFVGNPGLIRKAGRMVPASHAAARTVRKRYRKAQVSATLRWSLRKAGITPLAKLLLRFSKP